MEASSWDARSVSLFACKQVRRLAGPYRAHGDPAAGVLLKSRFITNKSEERKGPLKKNLRAEVNGFWRPILIRARPPNEPHFTQLFQKILVQEIFGDPRLVSFSKNAIPTTLTKD